MHSLKRFANPVPIWGQRNVWPFFALLLHSKSKSQRATLLSQKPTCSVKAHLCYQNNRLVLFSRRGFSLICVLAVPETIKNRPTQLAHCQKCKTKTLFQCGKKFGKLFYICEESSHNWRGKHLLVLLLGLKCSAKIWVMSPSVVQFWLNQVPEVSSWLKLLCYIQLKTHNQSQLLCAKCCWRFLQNLSFFSARCMFTRQLGHKALCNCCIVQDRVAWHRRGRRQLESERPTQLQQKLCQLQQIFNQLIFVLPLFFCSALYGHQKRKEKKQV